MKPKANLLELRKSIYKNAKRIVIKVGSSVITTNKGLNLVIIAQLAAQIARLCQEGKEIIFVSSGAIAAGIQKMGLKQKPLSLPQQQALAAIGQGDLIHSYQEAFATYKQPVAQVLLTRDSLINRQRYLNVHHAFRSLLRWKVIPIVNENDTVAVEEIKFGDNDFLAGLITAMLETDLLVFLTDIDGFYNHDPRIYPNAKRMPIIEKIDASIEILGNSKSNKFGKGGIASKIQVAKEMMALGIPMFIAKGQSKDILFLLFKGEDIGTFFVPQKTQLPLRKHWLASLLPKGKLVIDPGAVRALWDGGKSLLPSGIKNVYGSFFAGDPVSCINEKGENVAIGLVNYSSNEIEKIKGLKTREIKKVLGYKDYEEVIHRDNLCLIKDMGRLNVK
jgi:glutamate 5-kinase